MDPTELNDLEENVHRHFDKKITRIIAVESKADSDSGKSDLR